MLRIRLFRVLLPVLLVGIVVLLVWAIRAPLKPTNPLEDNEVPVRGGDDLTLHRWTIGSDGELIQELQLHAMRMEQCGDDCIRAFEVDRFVLERETQGPLEISADSTEVNGPNGERKMRFEGPVRVVDEELGLILDLPHLDVDEFAGVGRSSGAIVIEGAGHHTRADRLIYGLAGQATELFRLECEDDDGSLLVAERAFLHDGLLDIEMVQGVRFRGADDAQRFWAETSRVRRHEDGRMKNLVGAGKVVAGFSTIDGFAELGGDHLVANWDESGALSTLTIDGRALVEQGPQFVSADSLAFATDEDDRWEVDATGSVRLTGTLEGGTARIRADELSATFDAAMLLKRAEARGAVRFETPDVRADAAVARAMRTAGTNQELSIALHSDEEHRARLAQEQTRIAADTIRTDARGESMTASGRVESTLLPAEDNAALGGMFSSDTAVHFISNDLQAGRTGRELTFTGNVRGWQGEQNLSAQRVRVDHDSGSLFASGGVSTRFPRVREGAAAAASDDFVQVTAATLDYIRDANEAIYREGVRLVLAEGWIEGATLTVTQGPNGDFESLLAEGDVQLEFLGIDDGSGDAVPRTTGHADRLLYAPAEDTFWLYGDEQRARIQRGGDQAGTTEGRVLTYRLSDGNLSIVEGGKVNAPPPRNSEEAPE